MTPQLKRRSNNNGRYPPMIWIVTCIVIALGVFQTRLSGSIALSMTSSSTETHSDTNMDFELASRQSNGFFYDVPSESWKLLQHIVAVHNNHKFPNSPLTHNPGVDKRKLKYLSSFPAWYQTNYEPNFSCQFERRVGANGNGDGPKWVCDPHRILRMAEERKKNYPDEPGCVIYSVGSNGHYEFELGMQNILGVGTCDIHIFDPGDFEGRMPSALRDGNHTFYHQWGLAKQNQEENHKPDPDAKWQGMRDIVKMLGHEKRETIDIFKIDCEGCEWKTYQDWLEPDMPHMRQILIEVHKAPHDKVLDFFDKHEAEGFVRFHKEPNIQYNDGSCVEYAFLGLDKEFMPREETTEEEVVDSGK